MNLVTLTTGLLKTSNCSVRRRLVCKIVLLVDRVSAPIGGLFIRIEDNLGAGNPKGIRSGIQ